MQASLLAVLLGTGLLTGCGGGAGRRATVDRINYSPIDDADLKECKSPLRICVTDVASGFQGSVNRERIATFAQTFASAVQQTAPSPDACDLAIRFPNTWSDAIEVTQPFAAPHNAFVASFEVTGVSHAASALCAATAPGGLVHAKLSDAARNTVLARVSTAPRAPSYAHGPAPAAGLSTSDIERIAKAVQGGAPSAPAAAPATSYPASPAPRFVAAERLDDLAIIVGIESYSDIASKAPYAERDADAFKAHVRALGVPERNIVLLKGSKAGKASFEKNVDQWLPRMARSNSRVFFYFSGHGAPDVKTGQAYLVPWDGDPNFLESTGYSVAKLYKKLGELPAKQVLVAMDSCFSGAGGRSVLASGARPLVGKIDTGAAPAKITVLAASAANEISGSLDDKGHGAFTYFLLEGLNAGKTTPKALNEYLTPRVQDEARRLNRDQTPQLQGDGAWSLR